MARTADVVVIGSGGFGAAAAWQLARRGLGVALVDRHAIASQTSPRAAGLAATIRSTDLMTRLANRAADVLAGFEAQTGHPLGVVRSGSLKLAREPQDVTILEVEAERGRRLGIGTRLIPVEDAAAMHPLLRIGGVLAAMHIPSDLYFEPQQVAIAFAAVAAAAGAHLVPETPVTGIRREGGRVVGVDTLAGPIDAPVVVDAAGAWAAQVASLAGIRVPIAPVRHQLLITQPLDGVTPELPMLRIIDAAVYLRSCWGGLLVGGYEALPTHVDMASQPAGFRTSDVPLDLALLRSLLAKVTDQVPVLADVPIRVHRGGVPTMTPDGQHIVGPVPGAEGLFVAAGCNVSGLSISPAIGEQLASWIVDGQPTEDLSSMAITRFGPEWQDDVRVRAAADEHYATFYRATI